MFIDDCIEGILRIMDSDVDVPINLGSAETVAIDGLVGMVEEAAGIRLKRTYRPASGGNPRRPCARASRSYAWIYDQYVAREKRHARSR